MNKKKIRIILAIAGLVTIGVLIGMACLYNPVAVQATGTIGGKATELILKEKTVTTMTQAVVSNQAKYPELIKIKKFIDFIINVIRWGGSSIAGLISALTGWQILRSENSNGLDTAKKNLTNALWGLFFIFFGTTITNFLVNKMWGILLS